MYILFHQPIICDKYLREFVITYFKSGDKSILNLAIIFLIANPPNFATTTTMNIRRLLSGII